MILSKNEIEYLGEILTAHVVNFKGETLSRGDSLNDTLHTIQIRLEIKRNPENSILYKLVSKIKGYDVYKDKLVIECNIHLDTFLWLHKNHNIVSSIPFHIHIKDTYEYNHSDMVPMLLVRNVFSKKEEIIRYNFSSVTYLLKDSVHIYYTTKERSYFFKHLHYKVEQEMTSTLIDVFRKYSRSNIKYLFNKEVYSNSELSQDGQVYYKGLLYQSVNHALNDLNVITDLYKSL